ncbi:MAG: peroxide stress protein YaaA [Pseudohongiellaceae bacterium]
MLIVVSPAKSLDFESPVKTGKYTLPRFTDQSRELVETLREHSPEDLSELMNISARLGELNARRYMNWQLPFTPDNAKQAAFAFTGDVYAGLDVESLSAKDLEYAQRHLRILSGLYGVLRPLDLMQPYRLEMGTRLSVGGAKDLYGFWGEQITQVLNEDLKGDRPRLLVNLTSNEYFRSVKEKVLEADVISPVFKDHKNGEYKIISFYAKKARGMMAAWLIRHRITNLEGLTGFDAGGYRYSAADSTANRPVFLRKQT